MREGGPISYEATPSASFQPDQGQEVRVSTQAGNRRVPVLCEVREFIEYKTSMITDEDPLRGLLFY